MTGFFITLKWWTVLDLNQQPTNYEFAAQTIMLTVH
jgi:hypothetical protein